MSSLNPEQRKRFDNALRTFSKACKNIKNVNLHIETISLFFIREALINLVEDSINKRVHMGEDDEILLLKCEESFKIIYQVDNCIIQLVPDLEEFLNIDNVSTTSLEKKANFN